MANFMALQLIKKCRIVLKTMVKQKIKFMTTSQIAALVATAAYSPSVAAAGKVAACAKPRFFGLIPWYEYLKPDGPNCDILSFQILPSGDKVKSDIPLVLLAVVDDLLRLAGLITVGFVIYGAIQYILSQGNPDATARAQSTILNALIGLVIALVAVVGVNFVGKVLGA